MDISDVGFVTWSITEGDWVWWEISGFDSAKKEEVVLDLLEPNTWS